MIKSSFVALFGFVFSGEQLVGMRKWVIKQECNNWAKFWVKLPCIFILLKNLCLRLWKKWIRTHNEDKFHSSKPLNKSGAKLAVYISGDSTSLLQTVFYLVVLILLTPLWRNKTQFIRSKLSTSQQNNLFFRDHQLYYLPFHLIIKGARGD